MSWFQIQISWTYHIYIHKLYFFLYLIYGENFQFFRKNTTTYVLQKNERAIYRSKCCYNAESNYKNIDHLYCHDLEFFSTRWNFRKNFINDKCLSTLELRTYKTISLSFEIFTICNDKKCRNISFWAFLIYFCGKFIFKWIDGIWLHISIS